MGRVCSALCSPRHTAAAAQTCSKGHLRACGSNTGHSSFWPYMPDPAQGWSIWPCATHQPSLAAYCPNPAPIWPHGAHLTDLAGPHCPDVAPCHKPTRSSCTPAQSKKQGHVIQPMGLPLGLEIWQHRSNN